MTETLLPPQNLEAEDHVLGACLISQKAVAVAAEHVQPLDFYRASSGRIFETILDLDADGQPVDVLTVTDEMKRRGTLADAGGTVRMQELAALVPAAGNVGRYAEIVAEMALMRRIMQAGQTITRLALERTGETNEVLDAAETAMFQALTARNTTDFVTPADMLRSTFDKLAALMESGRRTTGLPTGYQMLDEYTSGLQNGNLIVLAARPSMGKSGCALGIASHVAVKEQKPVALFTLEMSRDEIMQRLVSLQTGVDSQALRNGRLSLEDWKRITDMANTIERAPLHIDDSGTITLMEMRAKARRLKLRVPDLALVIVDYLQLMTSGKTTESRVQEVSQISRSLKVLARDLDVPVLAVSQLSRAPEQRHDKRPILSDLRESGSIEQDADIVMFLYRDDYYHPEDTDSAGIAELAVAKHRNGPTGVIKLAFVKRLAKFMDLASQSDIARVA